MDPLTAGLMVGGPMIGGMFSEDAPKNYTGLQSKAQLDLINQMVRMMQQGGGEFGFGQAARSGNETLMNSLAQRGINQNSGVGQSALASMLAQAATGDAANRRQFGMQVSQAQAPLVNYQRLGQGWEGVPGYGDQNRSYSQRPEMRTDLQRPNRGTGGRGF